MGRTIGARGKNAPQKLVDLCTGFRRGYLLDSQFLVDLVPEGVVLSKVEALTTLVRKIDSIIEMFAAHRTRIRICVGVSGVTALQGAVFDRLDVDTWQASGGGTFSNRWTSTYKTKREGTGKDDPFTYAGMIPIACVTRECVPAGVYEPLFPVSPVRYNFDLEEDLVTIYGALRAQDVAWPAGAAFPAAEFRGSLPYARGQPPSQAESRVIYLVIGGDLIDGAGEGDGDDDDDDENDNNDN